MTVRLDYLPLLQLALSEPIGLVLRTNDPQRAKAALYTARAQSADPALANLQIRTSPFPEGDLLLCKGAPRPPSQQRLLDALDI